MPRRNDQTRFIQDVGNKVLQRLRHEDHLCLERICQATKASSSTVKRAIAWLRDCGASITYVAGLHAYRLDDRTFSLPLHEPSTEDLYYVLTAAGLLSELGQTSISDRAWALFEQLGERITCEKGRTLKRNALRVTHRSSELREPSWILKLLHAVGCEVVLLEYCSPWSDKTNRHTFEPWRVWLHDGVFYVRGFSRQRNAPRTFRVANIKSLARLDGEKPRHTIPPNPWGDDDPRYGVDNDRPGQAIIRFSGSIARWISQIRWHPNQEDSWIESGEILERRVPYRSVREFARCVLGVIDGVDSIEPADLQAEVVALANKGIRSLSR